MALPVRSYISAPWNGSFEVDEAICRLRDPDLLERCWQHLHCCDAGLWQWYYRIWLWLSGGRRWDWDPEADSEARTVLALLP